MGRKRTSARDAEKHASRRTKTSEEAMNFGIKTQNRKRTEGTEMVALRVLLCVEVYVQKKLLSFVYGGGGGGDGIEGFKRKTEVKILVGRGFFRSWWKKLQWREAVVPNLKIHFPS